MGGVKFGPVSGVQGGSPTCRLQEYRAPSEPGTPKTLLESLQGPHEESPNVGSQMGAEGHSLQLVHNRLRLCTHVAFLGPFCTDNFRPQMMAIAGKCGN